MKIIFRLLFLAALTFQFSLSAGEVAERQEIEKLLKKEGSYEYNLVGKKLMLPIDDALLKRLVAKPEETSKHDFILSTWLSRIAAEGDRKYLWLLEREELRKGSETADLLLAYDYNVNGNRKALDALLDRLQKAMKEQKTWCVPHLSALGAVNEWDLTRKALGSQALSADGAGNDERYGFWLTRRYFFPNSKEFPADYSAFCRDLEQLQAKAGQTGPRQTATPPGSSDGNEQSHKEEKGTSR